MTSPTGNVTHSQRTQTHLCIKSRFRPVFPMSCSQRTEDTELTFSSSQHFSMVTFTEIQHKEGMSISTRLLAWIQTSFPLNGPFIYSYKKRYQATTVSSALQLLSSCHCLSNFLFSQNNPLRRKPLTYFFIIRGAGLDSQFDACETSAGVESSEVFSNWRAILMYTELRLSLYFYLTGNMTLLRDKWNGKVK